jgi:hypothetical protein
MNIGKRSQENADLTGSYRLSGGLTKKIVGEKRKKCNERLLIVASYHE